MGKGETARLRRPTASLYEMFLWFDHCHLHMNEILILKNYAALAAAIPVVEGSGGAAMDI